MTYIHKALAKPPEFSYVPGNIWAGAVGAARHDIDLEQEFCKKYGGEMGIEYGKPVAGGLDVWVDPINGVDAGAGGFNAPYKTVKYAYQNVFNTIWLKPGRYTAKLDLRNTDRMLGSGQSRAVMIKAWAGKGTVVFVGAGQQPADMLWTSNSQRWEATPIGGEKAELIIYKDHGREIPIQWMPTAADVDTLGYGWHQDAVTKKITLRYENINVAQDASSFEIFYQTPGDTIFYGSKCYLKDIVFRGGNQIDIVYQGAIRPVFYAQNCTFEYLAGSNIHTEGAICMTQNCTSRRSVINDGFNYYDSNLNGLTPGGVPTLALEIDNICEANGIPETRAWSTNPNRNKQGSSGHGTTRVARINGVYRNNYGQNIADTGIGSHTWMVGSVLQNPYGQVGGGSPVGGYYNLWTEGTAWLDTVQAGGRLATYGLWAQGGVVNHRNCDFSGTVANVGGAGVLANWTT